MINRPIRSEILDQPVISDNETQQVCRSREASWSMYLYSIGALISAMSMGIVIGWSSTALNNMQHEHSIPRIDIHNPNDNYYMSWMGSCITLGALFGSLASGPITENFGRRFTLIALACPLTIGWLMIHLAKSYIIIIIGRVITGICAGIISNTAPAYVASIVTPNTRGFLGSCFQLLLCMGILFTACFGTILNWNELPLMAMVPALISSFVMCFATESPERLVKMDDSKSALRALEKLRTNQSDIDVELMEMEERAKINQILLVQTSTGSFLNLFRRADVYHPLIISVMLQFFQQFTGINAIMFYLVSIINDSGLTMDPQLASILINLALTISCLFSALLIDRVGRKVLLFISGVGMFISLTTMASYYINLNDSSTNQKDFTPLICLIVFVVTFAFGFGPIPWMIVGEITPSEAIGLVGSFATATNWFCAFLITKEFDDIITRVGIGGAFAMFSTFCLTSVIFIIIYVPETKHKSIQEIQRHFLNK